MTALLHSLAGVLRSCTTTHASSAFLLSPSASHIQVVFLAARCVIQSEEINPFRLEGQLDNLVMNRDIDISTWQQAVVKIAALLE